MKNNTIYKYHLFESTVSRTKIEMAKEELATRNEIEEDFLYSEGTDIYWDITRKKPIWGKQEHESDKIALSFTVGLRKNWRKNYPYSDYFETGDDPEEQINDYTILLNKCKFILKKMKSYSNDIHFKVNEGYCSFIIVFETEDDSKSLEVKKSRLTKIIDEYLMDSSNGYAHKTITLRNQYRRDNRYVMETRPERKLLFDTIKETDSLKTPKYRWDENKDQLQIRFASSVSTEGSRSIVIKIGPYKWKGGWASNMSRFVSFNPSLNKEQLKIVNEEVCKIIIGRLQGFHKIQNERLEYQIKENKIIIKIL